MSIYSSKPFYVDAYQFKGNLHNCPLWVAQKTEWEKGTFMFRPGETTLHKLKYGDWMVKIPYPFEANGFYYRVYSNEVFLEKFVKYDPLADIASHIDPTESCF